MSGYPKIPAAQAPELFFTRRDCAGTGVTRHTLARVDGQPLPPRMHAYIEVRYLSSLGHDIAEASIQARDRSGRRYTTYNSVEAASKAVLTWARRVIRERLAEHTKEAK